MMCFMLSLEMARMKIKKSRIYKTEELRKRANGAEGKGTHRSEGSNKRLKWLANVKECRRNRGRGCKKKG